MWLQIPEEHDTESQVRKEREWRFLRNSRVRKQAQQLIQKGERAGGMWGVGAGPPCTAHPLGPGGLGVLARSPAEPSQRPPHEHGKERQELVTPTPGLGPRGRIPSHLPRVEAPRVSLGSGITRLDDQIFLNRNPGVPSVVRFHPFTPCVAVADKDSIW